MRILVTGGARYIGSHTLVELINAGHKPVVLDNFTNSSREAVRRVEEITGKQIPVYEADCCDKAALSRLFDEQAIDAVIHLAGLKAVNEAVEQPLRYYRNNLDSTLSLCEVMQERGVKRLIFSSSATVYGDTTELPLRETSPTGQCITNPYGWTKYMIEQILQGLFAADAAWHITVLRYFNPIGAHPSGRIGEDPGGPPNNLVPYISQVAVGIRDHLRIFGTDYPTSDGTAERDYIHVVDLARGHVAALKRLGKKPGVTIYNLGTGKATSVLTIVKAFEAAAGKPLPIKTYPRRAGDATSCYADVAKAATELVWKAEKTIAEACADAWHWQSLNPNGYNDV